MKVEHLQQQNIKILFFAPSTPLGLGRNSAGLNSKASAAIQRGKVLYLTTKSREELVKITAETAEKIM